MNSNPAEVRLRSHPLPPGIESPVVLPALRPPRAGAGSGCATSAGLRPDKAGMRPDKVGGDIPCRTGAFPRGPGRGGGLWRESMAAVCLGTLAVLGWGGCAASPTTTRFMPPPPGTPAIELKGEERRALDLFAGAAGGLNPPTVTLPPGVYLPDASYRSPHDPTKRGTYYLAPVPVATTGIRPRTEGSSVSGGGLLGATLTTVVDTTLVGEGTTTGRRQARGWLFISETEPRWVGVMIEGWDGGGGGSPPHRLKGDAIPYSTVPP